MTGLALERLWRDLRFAARGFCKNPNFTLAVVLSLGIGIGGTCAFFSVLYGVLIDPYVYRDASRIIVPTFSEPDSDGRRPPLEYTMADFLQIEKGLRAFKSAILTNSRIAVTSGAIPRNVNVLEVSPNYFQFFGTPGFLGRVFVSNDVPQPQNPPPVAVLGYRFWMKEFNGNPAAIGRDLRLGSDVYKVIGVMPPRFTWFDTDVFTPQSMRPRSATDGSVYFRLRQGASLTAADIELQSLTEEVIKQNPARYPNLPIHMHAVPLQAWLDGKTSGRWIILMIAVSMLLLIACGNASVLLLARGETRKQEIAMRFALGASAGRIVRQLLTETLLLSLAGCALGLLLAWLGVPAILAALPENSLPHEAAVGMNFPVLLFAIVISLATGILAGLMPAFHLAGTAIYSRVQSGDRATTGRTSRIRTQTILVVTEIALSAMLLVCSAVAIRNLAALSHADLGYNPGNVAVLSVSAAHQRNPSWEKRRDYYETLERALSATAGVETVAETLGAVPPSMDFDQVFTIPGSTDTGLTKATVGLVSSDYFRALQTPLYAGRVFSPAEVAQGAQVAVVNQALARRLMQKGLTPVGSPLQFTDFPTQDLVSPPRQTGLFRIIGVVATIENQNLQQSSRPAIYLPYTYRLYGGLTILVRTRGNPQLFESTFQKRLHSLVDANEPLAEFDTLQHVLSLSSLAEAHSSATLFSIFASLAVALAAFGLYSVVSFNVAQRQKEFAIRRALGAQSGQMAAIVLKWMAGVMTAGTALGILGAFAFGNLLAYYEQGWRPSDPVTLATVPAVLLIVNTLAILPAMWQAVFVSSDALMRAQ